MKIAFVWTGFSGYMADCWRALAVQSGIDLRVWVEQVRQGNIEFRPDTLMRGLDYRWAYSDVIDEARQHEVEEDLSNWQPDVLFICGWARKWPPCVAKSLKLRGVPKILCCDMPWEWKLRKFAARFVLARHLRHFDKIYVPGRAAATYARWLGFSTKDIVCGEYSIDATQLEAASYRAPEERRGFIFVGRLVADKDIATLAAAYCQYRERGGLWPLDVYGVGPEATKLQQIDGVTLRGFAQPEDMAEIYSKSAVFVLPSRWEPWGVVVLEALAAGLRVVASDKVGSRLDLPIDYVFQCGNTNALAQIMLESERAGLREPFDVSFYSADSWAKRVLKVAESLLHSA